MTLAADPAPDYRSRWRRFSPSMGWKAFWSEIVIVVLGVAIALAANQAVEDWSWKGKVRDGEARLQRDLERIFARSAEHYATRPCVDAQLDRLARTLMDSISTLQPAPVHSDPSMPSNPRFVLRMPTRPWGFPAWEALVANGTATHFTQQWQDRFGGINENVAQMRDYRMESNRLVGRLMVLSYPLALDASARRDSLVDIEALRRQDVSMNVTGSQAMARILRDGLAPKPGTVDDFLQGSGTVAFCKEQGLPLADWRAVKPAPPDA